MKQTTIALLLVALSGCGLFKVSTPTTPPEDDGAAKVQDVLDATVSLAAKINGELVHYCSGVVVDGAIVTADHCVAPFFTDKFKDIQLFILYQSKYFNGVIVTRWESKDLAIVDAVGARLRGGVEISPWEPTYGMRVIWTGFPNGFSRVHLFAGFVSSPSSEYSDYTFDVDGQFIGGNSGGPILDEKGRLIGIVVSTAVGQGAIVPEIMPVGQAVLPEYIRTLLN